MTSPDLKPWEHFKQPTTPISHTSPITYDDGITVETWTYVNTEGRYSCRVLVLAPAGSVEPAIRRILADRRVWLESTYVGEPSQRLDEITAETLSVCRERGEWISS